MLKNIAKIMLVFAVFAFTFSSARPAKAFYLEMPQSLKNLLLSLKNNKTIAQEAPVMNYQPPAGGTYQPPTNMMPPSGDQGNYQGIGPTPGQNMGYQGIGPAPGMPDGQYQGTQGNYNPSPTCKINGVEQSGPCNQSGGQGMQGNYGPQGGQDGQGMQGGQGQGGPSPEQQARQLKDMKRGVMQSERSVKEFDSMIKKVEKAGTVVSDEIKQKLEKLKSIVSGAKNATTMEEMQDVEMNEMGDIMQSLDEFRRDVVEKQQRMEGMKRGMKGMEQGLKMFKSQIAKLTKQKITVPADVAENIAKLEAIITQVKTAKTSEEIDAIDFESLQDLMQNMDESRQKLETLARWPQTLKQIDQQLKQLTRELAKSKSIVDRLAKKGIDLQVQYTAFADAVNKMKSVRDDAVAKMAAGNSEEAFSALEDDFFGQMDDVWQHQRIIMTMSNLGRFTSEFKQGMAQANSMVKNLKRRKMDTSELEASLAQAKEKGQEVLDLLKAGNIDEDTVISALDELENLKQEFEAQVSELTGQGDEMPWEQGPQKFKKVEMSSDMQKFIPQRQETQMQQPPQVETAPMQPQAPMGPSGF